MLAVDDALGSNFNLRAGRAAETSGGLLVAMPSMAAALSFIADLAAADGQPAWVVGHVIADDTPLTQVEVGAAGHGLPHVEVGATASGAKAERGRVYAEITHDVVFVEV